MNSSLIWHLFIRVHYNFHKILFETNHFMLGNKTITGFSLINEQFPIEKLSNANISRRVYELSRFDVQSSQQVNSYFRFLIQT